MAKLSALSIKLVEFPFDRFGQDAQDSVNLSLWASPVIRRKGPECQILDAKLDCRGSDAPDVGRALMMPRQPWQPSLRSPAAIPVHDDGDVPRPNTKHTRGVAQIRLQ